MKLSNIAAIFALFTTFAALAAGQAPVQTAPVKVGVVNSLQFANPQGGITRLTTALRTLETEFKPRRDEIASLLRRFNELQKVPANQTREQLATRRDQAQAMQVDITRKQEDARAAYAKRLSTLTDPIRQSIFTALQAYAKQRGLDLLIDASKFPDGVYLMNDAADLTPGFIREYNSRNP